MKFIIEGKILTIIIHLNHLNKKLKLKVTKQKFNANY